MIRITNGNNLCDENLIFVLSHFQFKSYKWTCVRACMRTDHNECDNNNNNENKINISQSRIVCETEKNHIYSHRRRRRRCCYLADYPMTTPCSYYVKFCLYNKWPITNIIRRINATLSDLRIKTEQKKKKIRKKNADDWSNFVQMGERCQAANWVCDEWRGDTEKNGNLYVENGKNVRTADAIWQEGVKLFHCFNFEIGCWLDKC